MRSLKLAARTLWRRRRTSSLTLAVLALGIGLATAMWSVIDGVLVRGLPFPEGRRIVMFSTLRGPEWPMPPADFLALRERQRTLSEIAAFRTYNAVVTRPGEGSKGLTATWVTGNLFAMLGVEPQLGRSFGPADEEPSAPAVAVLSHHLWQAEFGGDPDVLGRTVVLNREPMTVVGVMPEGFRFPMRQEAWAALRWQGPWSDAGVFGVGKLRPGGSDAEARARLAPLVAELDAERPLPQTRQAFVRDYVQAVSPPTLQKALGVMLAAVLAVLLLACANAGSLRLGDSLGRADELAVRRALGAGNGHLIRLLVGEAAVLSAAGAALGLALAWAWIHLMADALLSGSTLTRQFWIDVRMDGRACAFAVATATAAVLIGGLVPALASIRRTLPRGGSRLTAGLGAVRTIRALVVVEVAIGFALVLGAGLLVRSGMALLSPEPGFDPSRLMRALVMTYQAELDAAESRGFWERLLQELETRPEIAGATVASGVPWSRAAWAPVRVDPADATPPADLHRAQTFRVWPNLFDTLRLPLLAGRSFVPGDLGADDAEAAGLPAVVSASFARRHFGAAALGRTFEMLPWFGDAPPVRVSVVGVAADLGLGRTDVAYSEDAVYLPFSLADGGAYLLARGRTRGGGLLPLLERAAARVHPLVGLLDDFTCEEERAEATWAERRLAQLFAFFAAVSLALSAVGLYGVIALSLRLRRRELAIRAALGALPRDLEGLLLGDGARCLAPGVLLGAALAGGANPFLRAWLYEVGTWDPAVTAASVIAVVLAAAAAVYHPARTAAGTDPAKVLHSE